MALITIPSGNATYDITANADTYVLNAGDLLATSISNGIDLNATNNNRVVIFGSVQAGSDGIVSINGSRTFDILIAESGSVIGASDGMSFQGDSITVTVYGEVYGMGDSGIEIFDPTVQFGRSTIQNYGNVYGASQGVYLDQTNCALFNSGTVSAPFGLYVSAPGTQVFNSGTITAAANSTTNYAVYSTFDNLYLENSGLIQSDDVAFSGGISVVGDILINSGTIIGTVELNDGDDTYLGREMGAAYDGVFGGIGNDYLQGSGADDYFEGDGGQDTLIGNAGADSLSGGSNNDTLIGGDGDDTLAGGAADDKLKGGDQDDLLDGGNGNDTLIGGRGEDTLIGGSGQDSLTGGADADVFQFLSASETPASGSRDRILDFELGVDLIDVSAIANFTFIGTAAFSLTPGELRLFESQNGNTKVIMDIDGDGLNDAEITVVGVHGLTAGDFVL